MIARLAARTLIVVGIAVILAGVIAELVGAKTSVEWEASIDTSNIPGAAMTVFAFSSSGRVEISVEGARSIYYMTLRGDPMIALRQLSTINISMVEHTLVSDIRAGVAYGAAGLQTNPLLLKTLPLLANILPVEVTTTSAGDVIEVNLTGGNGVLVVVEPSGDKVVFHMRYTVTGYSRLDTYTLTVLGTMTSLAGIIAYNRLTRPRVAGHT
ncbi:MAG: hypothetical protein GSR84_00780 [Desulfurococcales archaeon]|nr:hypothetical protein [Desulfurococcales archaeon]